MLGQGAFMDRRAETLPHSLSEPYPLIASCMDRSMAASMKPAAMTRMFAEASCRVERDHLGLGPVPNTLHPSP